MSVIRGRAQRMLSLTCTESGVNGNQLALLLCVAACMHVCAHLIMHYKLLRAVCHVCPDHAASYDSDLDGMCQHMIKHASQWGGALLSMPQRLRQHTLAPNMVQQNVMLLGAMLMRIHMSAAYLLGCARCWTEDRVRSPRGSNPISKTCENGLRSDRYSATACILLAVVLATLCMCSSS